MTSIAASVITLAALASFAFSQTASTKLSLVYPKEFSVVGRRVNVVLDPMTDWSATPFIQVSVGRTNYPVVDTASGRHAVQGIQLAPGLNTLVVKGLVPAGEQGSGGERPRGKGKDASRRYSTVTTTMITVFNQDGSFTSVPAGFASKRFHSRAQEGDCSGCHRLEVEPRDHRPANPQDMLCYSCHREVPSEQHVHGPAAVWNCLECHNPNIAPIKYQFTSTDPWKITLTEAEESATLFTVPADALFVPQTATLRSEEGLAVSAVSDHKKEPVKDANVVAEARRKKEKQDELLRPLLEHLRQHPTDKVRVEVHTDAALPRREPDKKGKGPGTPQELTAARAKVMARLFHDYGIAGKDQVTAVGMGTSLPKKDRDAVRETKNPNNRIEVVVHPADIPVESSAKLPVISDRKRIFVDISSSTTGGVRNIKVTGRLTGGMHYIKGSGSVSGSASEPQIKGTELTWHLGDRRSEFEENLSFVVKFDRGAASGIPPLQLLFTAGQKEEVRDLTAQLSGGAVLDIKGTCRKCHGDILSGLVKHGPADAGHCTLCHDPHGSDHSSWTRKQSSQLCAACHGEHLEEVHILKGITRNVTHPTSKVRDPSRPGKRLTCISCHSPHSAESKRLLAYGVRDTYEICGICHPKK